MGSETLDYMLWTVTLLLLYLKMIIAKDHLEYYTAYACDGKMLRIECKDGYVINLIRANYGRYSITVCNDNGSTDWSVNCMSHRSYSILQARCGLKRNCSVPASTSLFDDPCQGTVKYLEAHYACISATASSSTPRPTPPWLMTSPPSVWVAAKSLTMHPEIVSHSTQSVPPTSTTISSTRLQPQPQPEPEEDDWVTTNTVPPISESKFIVTSDEIQPSSTEEGFPFSDNDNKVPLCKPAIVRNLSWNWTSAGDVSVQPCPGGAAGVARWRCQKISENLAIRFPDTPDLSDCRSMWLDSLESRLNEGDSLTKIAADLRQVTESKMLFGGDMLTTVKIIRDLAQKMATVIQTFPDHRQREAMVSELLQITATIGSNLLDVSHQPLWKDLSYKEQMRIASSLLIGLEENSFLLVDTVVREKVVTHCMKNILLSVQVLETRNVDDEMFPTYSVVENCSLQINNWLRLQRSSLLENSEGGLVRLVYTAFDTLEHILKASPSNKDEKRINSKVLSASLGKGRHIQLNQPVVLCLQHLQTDNVSNPTCVFWDYTQNIWSEEGCTLVSTNETHTICRCNHLTNFAILVDVKAAPFAENAMSRSITILLGIVAVIMALVLSVIAFRYFRKHKARKEYSATFVGENEWFAKCFNCCQPSESEKTLKCKEPKPATYSNAAVQNTSSLDDKSTVICPTRASHTIPRSYTNENGTESNQYPGPHINPTYNRNGSIRKIKEARRLEHLENTLQHRNKKLAGTLPLNGPRSHTYSEIAAAAAATAAASSSRSDPVYEEIEREREHCSHISDVSDEDAKRNSNSDTSRQSSKSYGDHRPLIPYNPVTDRNFHAALDAAYRQQLREHSARAVSVLDGQTVVCHLQQSEPRIYHKSASRPPHHY